MSRGLTVTDPLHMESAARLREQFQNPTPSAEDQDLLMWDSYYDRAFVVELCCAASCSDESVQLWPIRIRSRALSAKAPRIRESAARLAEQVRSDGWSQEDYLAAVLSREVTAREMSNTPTRIQSAGFAIQKLLE